MKRGIFVAVLLAVFLSFGSPAGAIPSGAGEEYILVFHAGMTWEEAAAAVVAWGNSYHLATITSPEEQTYVNGLLGGIRGEFWMGGYQDSAGQWRWVTGETWSYTNWSLWQPAIASTPGSTQYLTMWNGNGRHEWLSDTNLNTGNIAGYFVERDGGNTTSVPIPAAAWLFGSGLTMLAGLRLPRRRQGISRGLPRI